MNEHLCCFGRVYSVKYEKYSYTMWICQESPSQQALVQQMDQKTGAIYTIGRFNGATLQGGSKCYVAENTGLSMWWMAFTGGIKRIEIASGFCSHQRTGSWWRISMVITITVIAAKRREKASSWLLVMQGNPGWVSSEPPNFHKQDVSTIFGEVMVSSICFRAQIVGGAGGGEGNVVTILI